MRKEQRWYEIKGSRAYIYNNPIPDRATSVSIVPVPGLEYYRTNFHLRKVWEAPDADPQFASGTYTSNDPIKTAN